jgi:hypothetical protein
VLARKGAGENRDINAADKQFENVTDFKYFGRGVTE